jgi:hypothetical protein
VVAAKRYEVPWARGWAFFASPPKDLELVAWARDLAALYPSEEESLASIAAALLSAPLGAPPRLLRATFHTERAHLVLYRLGTKRKEALFALLWWSQGPLPKTWLGGEPPPEEILALFREGQRLLREVGTEKLAELWRMTSTS